MTRKMIRTPMILALLAALLLAAFGLPQPVAAQNGAPVFFAADRILSYEQVRGGNPQWTQNSARRFMSAIWQFNADGTFYFAPTYDVRSDLYPMMGRYQVQGSQVIFSAASSAQIGYTGLATAMIDGVIDFSQDTPVVTMSWINTSGSAAVIRGIPFSGGSTTSYQIQATLATVQ
ncbi:MAG: hypothetical protein DCC55_21370 [Chloroflexi bacterium]|nr:MAG: hypothetical protein DCC55_21370 [Chloroflexota bacterium]